MAECVWVFRTHLNMVRWRQNLAWTICGFYTAKNNSVRLLKKLQEFGSSNLLRY
jgi:hypothetical protein